MSKVYSLAVRKKKNSNDCFINDLDYLFSEIKIRCPKRYWLADPFLFEKDGTTYIFFEAFDLVKEIGRIGYCILKSELEASKIKIIIKEKHHLSFPYIYENDKGIFIMPESSGNNTVTLYKSTSFPKKWRKEKVIKNKIYCVDSILLNDLKENKLLCSEEYRIPINNKLKSCWVKNRVYDLNDANNDGVTVLEGDYGVRNAGRLFSFNSNLLRPGQDCTDNKYGKGLVFFFVRSIDPYVEEKFYAIDNNQFEKHISFLSNQKKVIGVHTYNSTCDYEIIDFSYDEKIDYFVATNAFLYKKTRKLLSFSKRIFLLCLNMFKRIKNKVFARTDRLYYSRINKNAPWVIVSYITKPFYSKNNNCHQNCNETKKMRDVFNRLGYNVLFVPYYSKRKIPKINDVRIVFGHEPNFSKMCLEYPAAVKVLYVVSTYFKHRNNTIKRMTDEFNNTFGCKYKYERLLSEHDINIADKILMIGSKNTISTYPEEIQKKIVQIDQSTQNNNTLIDFDPRMNNEFVYLAGTGNVFKGAGLLLQYFSQHTNCVLHWIGQIDDDFLQIVKGYLTSNIKTYGYLDINGESFLGILEHCDFVIYPSGVEGVPGSVLNCMKNGMIPLVSPWASFDGISDLGYVMKDVSLMEINKAVDWAMSLSKGEVAYKKKECASYVSKRFSLDNFEKQFELFFKNL